MGKRRTRWLVGSFIVAAITGTLPASTQAAADCGDGEYVEMGAPMVIVLDGPGSAEEEQARWLELISTEDGMTYAYLEGHGEMTLGETTFDFERFP